MKIKNGKRQNIFLISFSFIILIIYLKKIKIKNEREYLFLL